MRLTTPARRAALLVLAAGCALTAGASWTAPVAAVDKRGPVGGPRLGTDGTLRADRTTALPAGLTAAAFVIADAGTGEVLAARAPHRPLPSASTMKVLTALAVIQQVTADRQVAADPADLAVECTCVGLTPDRVYTVDALVHAALMRSGNDAANVLATATGDRATALAAMNTLARRLRADDTHAATPSGLDAAGQHTSAYDLALIARAGLQDKRFRGYFNAATYEFGSVNGPSRLLTSQNMLRRLKYPGQVGGKDGWTTPARHTFVGAARRDGRTLIVSLLGADRSYGTQTTALLDWAFAQPRSAAGLGSLVRPRSDAELRAMQPAKPLPAPHAPPEGALAAAAELPADTDPAAQTDTNPAAHADVEEIAIEQADVDPLAAPEPSARPSPAPVAGPLVPRRHLPLPAQASLSLSAVVCMGLALLPGRRPRPTRPGGAPRPPARTPRSTRPPRSGPPPRHRTRVDAAGT
jgi:D-alanyl-D-alanine carboxypeptidase (penicillin-binding protein 5/6)